MNRQITNKSVLLQAIGLHLLTGVSWQEALADPRWCEVPVYLQWEHDKLDPASDDDVDGIYFVEAEALAAAAASPRQGSAYAWRVKVMATTLGLMATWPPEGMFRKALCHLVRMTRTALAALPAEQLPLGACTVQLIERPRLLPENESIYLDAKGRTIKLFEDVAGFGYDTKSLAFTVSSTPPRVGLFAEDGGILVAPQF
jgi:hypothetical protein